MMSRVFDIFVNYRTSDAAYGAASAYEALAGKFGNHRVFLDAESIPVGARYPKEILAALEEVSVLVVVIGPRWRATGGDGALDRQDDWVRREIRRAIERKIVIIPVLLDGASLPLADDLPADIRDLASRQYLRVGHRSLSDDLARLGVSVARSLPARQAKPVRAWRWLASAAVAAVTTVMIASVPSASDSPEAAESLIGDPRTADPCALTAAAEFAKFGDTKLDPAYGNFNRCDVIIHPEDGVPIDVEVQFDDGPPDERAVPGKRVGAVGIMSWPPESKACLRGLTLPPGDGERIVIVSADVDDGPSAIPLCEVADIATAAAARKLDSLHRSAKPIPRRHFPPESIANHDACLLPDSEALTAAIPGVAATEPDPGYGHWQCRWSSTTGHAAADVRFDQSGPLDATDGRPTRIDGRNAFLEPDGDGPGSCVARVAYRTHPGLYDQTVVESLAVTITDPDREGLRLCTPARSLARSAAGALR